MNTDGKPNLGALLKTGMERLLVAEYGDCIAPPAYITKTGVRHLDALLGGGISSSLPIMISSTPETGKSTFCFTFAKQFLDSHENSVVVYLDIEGASECATSEYGSRQESFGLDPSRFLYKPIVLNVKQVFDTIKQFAEAKKQFEDKSGKPFHVLIIWDSLAASGSSKDAEAEDHNQVIGFKAREISHMLAHHKSTLVMSQITTVIVDQVRANIKIESRFVTPDDKTVGEFSGFRSATNINALQHNIKQWLYLSKGKPLYPNDGLGVDGWELTISTVKNKLAPSQVSVNCVFDKKYGVIPLLSEYLFMRDMTKPEKKRTKNDVKKLTYPLAVGVEGRSKVISVIDLNGNLIVKSQKFTEKNLFSLYYSDSDFKKIFDKALELSITGRIKEGLFREAHADNVPDEVSVDPMVEAQASQDIQFESPDEDTSNIMETEDGERFDVNTGEII